MPFVSKFTKLQRMIFVIGVNRFSSLLFISFDITHDCLLQSQHFILKDTDYGNT